MSHIIGAIYTKNGVQIRCDGPDDYIYIKNGMVSYMVRSHESMIGWHYHCRYPKESLFDKLYLTLKK